MELSGKKGRVAWRVLETGAEGHGEYIALECAEAHVEHLNEKYANEMRHWVEKAPQEAPTGEPR